MADPFYTGQYSYRKPMVLIVGAIIFLATGIVLAIFTASAIVKPPHGPEILTALLMVGIVGTLFIVGSYLLWAFIRRHRIHIEIDDRGIRYGKKSVPWERVRRIAGWYHGQRFQLKLVRRGFASDLHLTTDDGLTEKEYQRLMSLLTAQLEHRFPDLKIG